MRLEGVSSVQLEGTVKESPSNVALPAIATGDCGEAAVASLREAPEEQAPRARGRIINDTRSVL
jgi:hypothetical protein